VARVQSALCLQPKHFKQQPIELGPFRLGQLGQGGTVLSSDAPVRVFQQFATLDLISGGRAEIIAGRGSYIESFPLFGYDLNDYSELFADKHGRHQASGPLRAAGVVGTTVRFPRPRRSPS
jgi:hypothetical protein